MPLLPGTDARDGICIVVEYDEYLKKSAHNTSRDLILIAKTGLGGRLGRNH